MVKQVLVLGSKASVFHDPVTGITISPNEKVEYTPAVSKSRAISSALNGGHLMLVSEEVADKEAKKDFDNQVKATKDYILGKMSEGVTASKIAEGCKLDNLKALAESEGCEVEKDDTKKSIVEALMEVFSEEE